MVKSLGDWFFTHFFMWNAFDAKKNLKVTKKIVTGDSNQAIIFYPYWTGNPSLYNSFAKKFSHATQVFYEYPNEVYSENVQVSLGYIKELLLDSVSLIRDLRTQGITEIVLVGSSFGANIAFKVSTLVKVEKVVLNMLDRDLANAIFRSSALTILRRKLERKGFTLSKLKKVYHFLSLDKHLKDIKSTKTKFLFLISATDIFTPAKSFTPLFHKMDRLKIDYSFKINRFLGHVLGIYYNVNFSSRIANFIED